MRTGMTFFQRAVVAVTATAAIAQLLFPPLYFSRTVGERPDLPATVLRVLAILIAGGTLVWLIPHPPSTTDLGRGIAYVRQRFTPENVSWVVIAVLSVSAGVGVWQSHRARPIKCNSRVSCPDPCNHPNRVPPSAVQKRALSNEVIG